MAVVLDTISQAMKELGVLSQGEVPNAGEAADGLVALNNVLDGLKLEELSVYTSLRVTATLTASQSSFTVGTGGNINTPRPVWIDRVGYVDNNVSPAAEYPLRPMSDEGYSREVLKGLTGTRPLFYYYRPDFPLGTLFPCPIPTDANLLWVLYVPAPVDEFAATGTTLSMPPGYKRMLETLLAIELAAQYEREPSPSLMRRAMAAKAAVKRANYRVKPMVFSPEYLLGAGRSFNIKTGQ